MTMKQKQLMLLMLLGAAVLLAGCTEDGSIPGLQTGGSHCSTDSSKACVLHTRCGEGGADKELRCGVGKQCCELDEINHEHCSVDPSTKCVEAGNCGGPVNGLICNKQGVVCCPLEKVG